MSHEIRTSMNGAMGVTKLLLARKLDTKQQHCGKLIFRSASNLIGLAICRRLV
jgi:signal transduction histidine kinase